MCHATKRKSNPTPSREKPQPCAARGVFRCDQARGDAKRTQRRTRPPSAGLVSLDFHPAAPYRSKKSMAVDWSI
jgi:hypothetical protein